MWENSFIWLVPSIGTASLIPKGFNLVGFLNYSITIVNTLLYDKLRTKLRSFSKTICNVCWAIPNNIIFNIFRQCHFIAFHFDFLQPPFLHFESLIAFSWQERYCGCRIAYPTLKTRSVKMTNVRTRTYCFRKWKLNSNSQITYLNGSWALFYPSSFGFKLHDISCFVDHELGRLILSDHSHCIWTTMKPV